MTSCSSRFFFYGLLLAVFVFEFLLFRTYVLQEVAPYYPQGVDQASYLKDAYVLYDSFIRQGVWVGLFQLPSNAASTLFVPQAALLFVLTEASRFNALLPNFFYFVAFQAIFVLAAKRLSHNIFIPLFALGLLLACRIPFKTMGGMADFRIDFIAFCLYGICISCVLVSKVFIKRRWIMVAAVCAMLLILMRSVTAAYLGILGVLLLLWFPWTSQASVRMKNLLLFGTLMTVMVLPFLWLKWDVLYEYYGVGHVLGGEKYIRAKELGTENIGDALIFYPRALLLQLNGAIWGIAIILLGLVSYGKQTLASSSLQLKIQARRVYRTGYIFLILSIIAPLIPLTLDMSKSSVAAGIMAPPVLWLLVWALMHFEAVCHKTRGLQIFAIVVLMTGIAAQIHAFLFQPSSHKEKQESAQITRMYDEIGDYAHKKQWPQIKLSLDRICDYLLAGNQTVLYYERKKILLEVALQRLGAPIFAVTKEEALASLKNSNVVILNQGNYQNESPYPFDSTVAQLKPLLKEVAERDFVRLNDYTFRDSVYRVYVRP